MYYAHVLRLYLELACRVLTKNTATPSNESYVSKFNIMKRFSFYFSLFPIPFSTEVGRSIETKLKMNETVKNRLILLCGAKIDSANEGYIRKLVYLIFTKNFLFNKTSSMISLEGCICY